MVGNLVDFDRLAEDAERALEATPKPPEDLFEHFDAGEPAPPVEDCPDFEDESEAEKTISPMKETLYETIVDLQDRYSRTERFAGEECGFLKLDETLDGWERQLVYLMGGRPGMGKSIVGLNIGLKFASKGLAVDHITIEMTKKKQALRALFCWSRVQSHRMKFKTMRPEDWQAMNVAIQEMKDFPWYWDDRGTTTVDDIRKQVQLVKRKFEERGQKLFLVIIDHILNIRGTKANESKNRREQVLYITNQLKAIAKAEDVCVLALTQMKRLGGMRRNKRPTLEDLKESGSSEEDADVVILLHREDYYEKNKHNWTNILEMDCAKVRDGEPAVVKFRTDLNRYRIDLLEPGDDGYVEDE